MYGLEDKKQKKQFSFDLEKEIHDSPKKGKELLKKAEDQVQQIKEAIRKGSSSKELQDYGILLHGYNSLQKVLKKMMKSQK